jgi:thiamine-monophosphate kinase
MNEEQKIIQKYFLPIAKNSESLQLSNDAAFLNKKQNMVISSDMMIEDIHFDKFDNPFYLAQKLLRVNLSDIAAMGAIPYGYILNLSIPKLNHKLWLKKFCKGLAKDTQKFNLKLFGGDLGSSKNIFMSVTILGLISGKFHNKTKAYEGSEIFVSGTLGDAGIGLQIKKGQFSSLNKTVKNFFLSKLHKPIPEIKLGKSLIGIADFCKDISDGFLKEMKFITEISNLQANIFLSEIPLSSHLRKIYNNIEDKKKIWEYILCSGEDYKLFFSVSPKNKYLLKKKNIKNVKCIGYFQKGKGLVIRDENKKIIKFQNYGFSHF